MEYGFLFGFGVFFGWTVARMLTTAVANVLQRVGAHLQSIKA